jgi:hypothetical protein
LNSGDERGNEKGIIGCGCELEIVVEKVDLLKETLKSGSIDNARDEISEIGVNYKAARSTANPGHLPELHLVQFLKVGEVHPRSKFEGSGWFGIEWK